MSSLGDFSSDNTPVKCSRNVPKPDETGEGFLDDGCNNIFTPKVHNQIFCCSECTRLQTNANIMEKYYDKKKQRSGIVRICQQCNYTRLSRYNDEKICIICQKNPERQRTEEAMKMISRLGKNSALATIA